MNHFTLEGGALQCEGVGLEAVAQAVGTPVYVYSTATLERHFRVFRDALRARPGLGDPLIAYAVKANGNLSVLASLARLGAGADTVSEGEIRRALAAGVPPTRIVFSGVGKTASEIAFALDEGLYQINVESESELFTIERLARELGVAAPVAIRINPDIGAGGHRKISTGSADSKFGVAASEAERLYAFASASDTLAPVGLACHIGSQITSLEPFEAAFARMRTMIERLRGQGFAVDRLDLGGGLGAPYFNQPDPPTPEAFAAMTSRVLAGLDAQLIFEPGRLIAANAGALLARVIHIHRRPDGRSFLVLDAAMNDLIRPAMYDAYHDIRPIRPRHGAAQAYDVVGPICESGDTFTRERLLPPLAAGDLVAFMTAGAYGAVMASEYNSRPLVPEVLVRGDDFAVVRPRPAWDEILSRDRMAPWLAGA